MYKQIILGYLADYLKKTSIKIKKSGKIIMLSCPFCEKELSATIIPNTNIINCFHCKQKYNLIDIVRKSEFERKEQSEEEILQYLKELLNINVITQKDEKQIDELLDFYEKNGFDLVPIAKNAKNPVEKDWTNKEHKDKEEWKQWIANGLNIGVKTGIKSGITVIDIDTKDISEKFKAYLDYYTMQKTKNGFHIFFKYDNELPKSRIDEIKIDIENDGGQVVLAPSIVEDEGRMIKNDHIELMPIELKKLLQEKITIPRKTISETVREEIDKETYRKPLIKEGEGRNDLFIRLGGILRKELNLNQTEYAISILNKIICNPPLEQREINAMIGSLEKYVKFDEQELAHKILQYLKDAEEATKKDIELVVTGYFAKGELKKKVDKTLAYLLREGYILKRGRYYHSIKKAEWKTSLLEASKSINFKMPYFYDIANFNWGDLVLISSKNKKGKTHLSMNIVKRLVEQGIKPYYISLETGCYDEQTEILTNKGWKYFKDLDKTEKVATLNPDTNEIEYQKPINYFKYDYRGKMLSIQTRYLDLVVTPNHKQPMFIRNSDKIKLYQAELMPKHNIIPKIGKWKGKNQKWFVLPEASYQKYLGKHKKYYTIKKESIKIKIDDWLEFLGIYLAEGNCSESYRISISQQTKTKQVEAILNKLPFEYYYTGHQFKISDIRLAQYCKQFGKSFEKFVPNFIKQLSPKLINNFLKGYCLGDGYIRSTSQRNFFTVSKRLANDIQELIFKLGYFANINIRKSEGTYYGKYQRNHDLYWIAEVKNLKGGLAENRRWIDYSGKVYDVEVPNYHILYVRRNGKPVWSGNSRFARIALQLGLKEGDFKWDFVSDPTKIELESNAVTIIDWLLIIDKAKTDLVFKHFIEQLYKTKGFLIVFQQLKQNSEYFAPNMVTQFPSLSARYLYDKEEIGEYGKFQIDVIREPKFKIKSYEIPCRYFWDTKELLRIDEIDENTSA